MPTPGHHLPEPGSDPHINRVTDSSGKITDVTSPNIKVDIDPALSQQMRGTGDPNAPKSDAELLGHELKETEHQDFEPGFKSDEHEEQTNGEVDSMLDSSKDMSKKDAERFVDDLLKPNSTDQHQPPPPPPPCTPEKGKPCPN